MARRNDRPEFAVIGLGRFGRGVALTLVQRGYNVLGIDRDRDLVQHLADDLTQTVSLDSTDEEALQAVDISAYDTVIVAIGQDFESNLLTTVALKSVGVRRVICKTLSQRQKTILLKIGADQVVLPEHEAGQRLAFMLTTPLMLDQLPLGTEYSISETRVPPGFVGKPLGELVTRSRLRVTVVAVKRTTEVVIAPPQALVLAGDDILVTIGETDQVTRFADLD